MMPSISIVFHDGTPSRYVAFVQSINFVMGRCNIRMVGEEPLWYRISEIESIDFEPRHKA